MISHCMYYTVKTLTTLQHTGKGTNKPQSRDTCGVYWSL